MDVPKYYLINKLPNFEELSDKKFILKPKNANDSKGISLVSYEEINSKAKILAENGYDPMCQEYLEGKLLNVDVLVRD